MKRHFTIDEEILINQFTQQIHSFESMEKWFNSYSITDKREIILNLLDMVIQAHPTYEEIFLAADKLKKSSSPSAIKLLNKNKPYTKFGYELANLPEKELVNGFGILLITLSIADGRRKSEECSNGCNHWWHRDLSDESILQELKQQC